MAQMRQLASYQTFGVFANRPALDLAERLADLAPARRPAHLPRLGRRRRHRHGRQARPPLLRRDRHARAHAPHLALAGLPRHPRPGHVDRRHPGQPPGRRPAGPRRLASCPTTRSRRSRPRSSASAPIASPRSSSSPSSAPAACTSRAPGYIEGVAELCARTGVLFVVRLGHRRLRAPGHLVRHRALGRAPRHAHLRQGRDQRLPAARRRRRRRQGRGALLGGRRLVPPRPDLLRAPDGVRGRDGQPRHHRARGPARPRARARGRDRAGAAPARATTRWSARSAPASAPWARSPSPARRWPRRPTCPRGCSRALRERGVLLRPLGDGLAFSPPLVITREQVDARRRGRGRGAGGRGARRAGGGGGAVAASALRAALAAPRGAYCRIEGKGVAWPGARGAARASVLGAEFRALRAHFATPVVRSERSHACGVSGDHPLRRAEVRKTRACAPAPRRGRRHAPRHRCSLPLGDVAPREPRRGQTPAPRPSTRSV